MTLQCRKDRMGILVTGEMGRNFVKGEWDGFLAWVEGCDGDLTWQVRYGRG